MKLNGNIFRLIPVLYLFWCSPNLQAQIPDTGVIVFPNWHNLHHIKDLLKPKRPDTILIGDFVMVVERYDSLGRYVRAQRRFENLSGVGRVLFSCQQNRPPFGWHNILSGAPLTAHRLTVVDSVVNPAQEIALQDARMFDKNILRGKQITLNLPLQEAGQGARLADLISQLRLVYAFGHPTGVRVQFDNVSITYNLLKKRWIAGAGVAVYPSKEPAPEPPFILDIEGFQLAVSALKITPGAPAVAKAQLFLPDLISNGTDCARASVDLGLINLSANCEFYKDMPGTAYGSWGVGATTLVISGKGYTADFSSTTGVAPGGGAVSWKGLILHTGSSDGAADWSVYSNTGYLNAGYDYSSATVTKTGFSGQLSSAKAYGYYIVQPFGYAVRMNTASLVLKANKIASGSLKDCVIALPADAVRDRNGAPLSVHTNELQVKGDLDSEGSISDNNFSNMEFFWGRFIEPGKEMMTYGVTSCKGGSFYFPGTYQKNYYPVAGDAFAPPPAQALFTPQGVDTLGIPGMSVFFPNVLYIQTPDVPAPPLKYFPADKYLTYRLTGRKPGWFNVAAQGVHAGLYSDLNDQQNIVLLGDTTGENYVGKLPFLFGYFALNDKLHSKQPVKIALEFVESAVMNSDVQGNVLVPPPAATILAVKKMNFTSTAQISGGEIDLSSPAKLDYWGLQLVPKPGFASAGVLSVKTGQIVLTAAGLAEPRHFKEPFYLTWGELLASGNMGRLFFDYHTAGQQFDGLDFSPDAVALSPATGPAPPYGFLRVGGMVYLPLFGPDYLHLIDQYDPTLNMPPFNERKVSLSDTAFSPGFMPTDSTIEADWFDGLAHFNFDLVYNTITQDGLGGFGVSRLSAFLGGDITSNVTFTSSLACIGMKESQTRTLQMGFADMSSLNSLWGCACIRNNHLDQIVVGGEVTNAANAFMVGVRAGQSMSAITRITPTSIEFTLDGTGTISVALSLDMELNGHFSTKLDFGNQFIEGEMDGFFRMAQGAVLAGSSISGSGQANWHIGFNPVSSDAYQSIQGSISLSIMNGSIISSSGEGLATGFYLGRNAPKSEAWVILGADPRYQLNMAAMPDRLTGVYAFVQYKKGINLFIVSGEYEVFVGLGAFTLDVAQAAGLGAIPYLPGTPYVLGNLGGRIHGEILGGLVSAGAWFNLQLLAPYPFHFQGTVGLEGCALWVACASVDITIGLNTEEGFYIR